MTKQRIKRYKNEKFDKIRNLTNMFLISILFLHNILLYGIKIELNK